MNNQVASFSKEYIDLPRQKAGSEKTQLMEFLTIAHIDSVDGEVASDGDLYVDIPMSTLIQYGVTRGGTHLGEDLDRVFDRMSDMKVMTERNRFVVFQKMKIDNELKAVTIKVDGDIAPYFIQLRKNFGSIQLKIMFSDLSTFYARKIYSYLRPKLHTGQQFFKFTVSIKDFREAMGFERENKMTRYDLMKKRFLVPGIKEICESSDISASFTEIRAYRKGVIELTFNVGIKECYTPSLGLNTGCINEISDEDASYLLNIGFKAPGFIDAHIELTSLEAVERAINEFRTKLDNSKVKSLPAYFRIVLPALADKYQLRIQKREALLVQKKSLEDAKSQAKAESNDREAKRKGIYSKWKGSKGGSNYKALCDKLIKDNPDLSTLSEEQLDIVAQVEWKSVVYDQMDFMFGD